MFDGGQDRPNHLLLRASIGLAVVNAVELEVGRGNLVEDEGVGRTTEAEHAQQVALLDVLALSDELLDARHLSHTDLDHSHTPDIGLTSVDDVDLTDGSHGEQGLGSDVALSKVGGETGVSSVVGVTDLVALLHDTRDGRSPAVIAPGVEEALEDSSTLEVGPKILLVFKGHAVSSEHLGKRVALVLEPELVVPFGIDIRHFEVGVVFGVVEDLVVGIRIEGTSLFLDFAGEPVMPTREAIVISLGIADEVVVVDTCKGCIAEPSIRQIVHVSQRICRIKHLSIDVVDGLQVFVDFLQGEEGAAGLSVQQIDHQRVEGNTDNVLIGEGGRSPGDLSKLVEQLVVGDVVIDGQARREGSDGAVLGLDILVDVFRDFIEASLEVHLGDGVFADVSPEVFHLLDGEDGPGFLAIGPGGAQFHISLQLFAPVADSIMLSLEDLSSPGALGEPLRGEGAGESLEEHHRLILSIIRQIPAFNAPPPYSGPKDYFAVLKNGLHDIQLQTSSKQYPWSEQHSSLV